MYLVKLALRPWRQFPYSQLFTSVAVGVMLFLAGFLFWIQRGMGPVIGRLENEQVITAYLDPALDSQAQEAVVDEIRLSLGAHQQTQIELVHADKFLNHLRGDYPELAQELEDLGDEMKTVIPEYVSISGILPAPAEGLLGRIRTARGVRSAESSTDRFRNVIGAFRALEWIATLLFFGIALTLATGLLHLCRTNAHLHRESAALLKLMGAGEGARRAPGLISGFLVGTLGGAIAALAWLSVGVEAARHVRTLSPVLQYLPIMQGGFALALLACGMMAGAVSGFAASPRVRGH